MIKVNIQNNLDIARITLSNNDVNAISISMLNELDKAIDDILLSKKKCLIISSDQKHFCAGADLKERSGFSNKETLNFLDSINSIYHKIESLPIPTIAVINGGCLGGGLELALSCDFRIGLDGSFYGFPETSIGIIPGAGGTQRMTRLTGIAVSMEWIFTAEKYAADKALSDKVIDFLIEEDNLNDYLDTFIERILKNAPLALKAGKRSIGQSFIDYGFMLERNEYIKTLKSKDRNEGLAAFKEKRAPDWENK